MTLRERFHRWLLSYLGITQLTHDVNGAMTKMYDIAVQSQIDTARTQAWASIIATNKALPQFNPVICPVCKRNYPQLALRGRSTAFACHCGHHLEVNENGEVHIR